MQIVKNTTILFDPYQGKSIYLHMNIIYKQRTIKHATCAVRFGDRASYGINGRYFL